MTLESIAVAFRTLLLAAARVPAPALALCVHSCMEVPSVRSESLSCLADPG